MDVNDQLRDYTLKLVALGQEALSIRRTGDWLPDSLAALADELLALESAFGPPHPAAAPAETPAAEPEMPLETPYPPIPAIEEDANEWPTRPAETGAPAYEADVFPDDALLVLDVDLDVDEEPGGGPAFIDAPLEALPPLVIDVAAEPVDEPADESVDEPAADAGPVVSTEEVVGIELTWPAEQPEPEAVAATSAVSESNAAEPADAGDWPAVSVEELATQPELKPTAPAPVAADEPRFCINCGEKLRPGKRFCHRCGLPISEMGFEPVDEMPTPAGAQAIPRGLSAPAETPPPVESAPSPAVVPADITQFCNNCGLGLAAGVTVCPDCGSRDIS